LAYQSIILYSTIVRLDDQQEQGGLKTHHELYVLFASYALNVVLLLDAICNHNEVDNGGGINGISNEAMTEVVGEDGTTQRGHLQRVPPPRQSPEDNASFLSIYTFWWMWPILTLASKNGKLVEADIPPLPKLDRPPRLVRAFTGLIPKLKRGACWSRAITLFVFLSHNIQRPVFWFSFLHGWLFQACMLLDPIVLNVLLKRSQGGAPVLLSLVLVLGLSISMAVRVTCMEITYFASVRVANNGRTALVHSVFKKALTLGHCHCSGSGGASSVATSEYDAGKLTNLMATDADKIGKSWWVTGFLSQWTWAVLSLPLVTYFLHKLVGNAAFVAIATIIITNYVNLKVGRATQPVVRRLQERRDERSSMLKELLMGIKVR
jgi:hypothetical protein